ncbi:Homocysteine-responsive endoplasmic reticulum-resident ubiquitin-like domain member 2 protein, partial [Pseudolycoriella hygida]
MDNNPVTIIVKAPNQQFEDQTVRCELSWTIKRLKGLLSEVYPSKPKTDEQRLIYSGQLLNDTIVLKDVLRQYEGQDTHTVHLVLQPNKVFEASNTNMSQSIHSDITADGLRQRIASQNRSSASSGPFHTQTDWSNSFMDPARMADINRQYNEWVSQQLPSYNLMVEQIYRQYYNQYMSSLNQPNNLSQNGGLSNLPQMPYYPQNYFATPNLYSSPFLQQQNNQSQQPQVPQAQEAPQPQVQQIPQQQPLPEQQPNPAQQRFPNIVQEEVENRDWLDLFYAFSRLMVLVTLVYFYSSPLRCLIVIFFIILYYGYHVGYFRQLNREPNNNQPPNVAPPANNNENALALNKSNPNDGDRGFDVCTD